MRDGARIGLIFGAVAVVAAGGGYWFLKIHRPKQVLQNAQDEVTAWEARWAAARGCLLGTSPASAKTSEALAIRELLPDPWEAGKCTSLVGKLTRGDAPDTGLADVEDAWVALDQAATKAAAAFGLHVGARELAEDKLPAALDGLDAARAHLRAAAQLPPDVGGTAGPALPQAQLVPIADGADGVTELTLSASPPSAHGVILRGKTASRIVQVELTAGGAPRVQRVGPYTYRSPTDPTWGAVLDDGDVRVGTFDAEGVIAAPIAVKAHATRVFAAVGAAGNGLVVAEVAPGKDGEFGPVVHAALGRAKGDALEIAPDAAAIASQSVAVDVDGRALAVWTEPAPKLAAPDGEGAYGRVHAQVVAAGAEQAALAIGTFYPDGACLGGARAFVHGGDHLISFGADAAVARTPIAGELTACYTDTVLVRAADRMFGICDDARCRTPDPLAAKARVAPGVVGGKLVGATTHGSILALWREGTPHPMFYGLPSAAAPAQDPHSDYVGPYPILTDGKVLDVLVKTAGGYAIARVPL